MAGIGHAGVVRVEHAAIALCAATVAAVVPLVFLNDEAQAAASDEVAAARVVDPATTVAPKAVGRMAPQRLVEPVAPSAPTLPKPIPAAVAPREELSPRALAALIEPPGAQAFAPAPAPAPAATEQEPTAEPAEPVAPKPPPVSVSPTPSGWYTPVAKYYFSARYGVAGSWSSGRHTGLDFVTRNGAPIRATADGVVVAAASAGAYGNLLQIKVAPKTQVWMAHLQRFNVKPGDVVKAGEIVGWVGMTGNTSGPHCHFEVRVKDKPTNPERFFWPTGKVVTRINH